MNLETALAILQQSEYHWHYFVEWYRHHSQEKLALKPKEWTSKLRLIKLLSRLFFFCPILLRLKLALQLSSVIEYPIKQLILFRAKQKLTRLKQRGLTVVAIAGSYAKTSTKHILTHALATQRQILMTPASINTPLGISQIIIKQLSPKHDLFIVELGEYYSGDILTLARFVQPDFGIVTPIGHQHLERMGSLEKIAQTIGELIQYFKSDPTKLLIAEENLLYFSNQLRYYGLTAAAQLQVTNSEVSLQGTEFEIVDQPTQRHWSAFTPLFGTHQAVNSLPAVWLAERLSLDVAQVVRRLSTTPYISRRHEPTFAQQGVLILDNSYNTNPESMRSSLELLSQLPATQRAIITMGFVELGESADAQHYQLGQILAKHVDYVGLITSRWNHATKQGFMENGGPADHFREFTNQDEALAWLQPKIVPQSIILFEGGYQEIFS